MGEPDDVLVKTFKPLATLKEFNAGAGWKNFSTFVGNGAQHTGAGSTRMGSCDSKYSQKDPLGTTWSSNYDKKLKLLYGGPGAAGGENGRGT